MQRAAAVGAQGGAPVLGGHRRRNVRACMRAAFAASPPGVALSAIQCMWPRRGRMRALHTSLELAACAPGTQGCGGAPPAPAARPHCSPASYLRSSMLSAIFLTTVNLGHSRPLQKDGGVHCCAAPPATSAAHTARASRAAVIALNWRIAIVLDAVSDSGVAEEGELQRAKS